MPTENLIEPTLPASEAEQPAAAPKAPWHAPVITRIDLKRTMAGGSALSDGGGRQTAV